MTSYTVSCDHVADAFRRADAPVDVREDQGRYHVIIPGFGCSRSYSTPEIAITEMLRSHACTNIRVNKQEA